MLRFIVNVENDSNEEIIMKREAVQRGRVPTLPANSGGGKLAKQAHASTARER